MEVIHWYRSHHHRARLPPNCPGQSMHSSSPRSARRVVNVKVWWLHCSIHDGEERVGVWVCMCVQPSTAKTPIERAHRIRHTDVTTASTSSFPYPCRARSAPRRLFAPASVTSSRQRLDPCRTRAPHVQQSPAHPAHPSRHCPSQHTNAQHTPQQSLNHCEKSAHMSDEKQRKPPTPPAQQSTHDSPAFSFSRAFEAPAASAMRVAAAFLSPVPSITTSMGGAPVIVVRGFAGLSSSLLLFFGKVLCPRALLV